MKKNPTKKTTSNVHEKNLSKNPSKRALFMFYACVGRENWFLFKHFHL